MAQQWAKLSRLETTEAKELHVQKILSYITRSILIDSSLTAESVAKILYDHKGYINTEYTLEISSIIKFLGRTRKLGQSYTENDRFLKILKDNLMIMVYPHTI